MIPLQESVNAAAVDVGGWVIFLGGLVATAAWYAYLTR